jgi:hypothetical protein
MTFVGYVMTVTEMASVLDIGPRAGGRKLGYTILTPTVRNVFILNLRFFLQAVSMGLLPLVYFQCYNQQDRNGIISWSISANITSVFELKCYW